MRWLPFLAPVAPPSKRPDMIEISDEYIIATVDAAVSAFRLGAGFPLRTLASVTGLGMAELDAMVAEATIDCHDEEEQLTGLATMVENNLEVPFTTTILGLAVTVTGATHASHGLVAD